MIGQTVTITRDQVTRLVLALSGRVEGKDLSTEAMKQAVSTGLFLKFDPACGTLTESPAHVMLCKICKDIERLRVLDGVSTQYDIKDYLSPETHGISSAIGLRSRCP